MKYPLPSLCALIRNQRNEILIQVEGERYRLPGGRLEGGSTWLESLSASLLGVGVRGGESELLGVYTELEPLDEFSPLTVVFTVTGADVELKPGCRWIDPQSEEHALRRDDRIKCQDMLTGERPFSR